MKDNERKRKRKKGGLALAHVAENDGLICLMIKVTTMKRQWKGMESQAKDNEGKLGDR